MLPRGFRFVGLMLKAALLVLPEDDGPDSRETKGALRTAWREFQAFQARSPIWRLALMAVLYTVGFMVVRLLLTQAMGIFQNVWIAGGISALVAPVIVAPTLISNLIKAVGSKTRVKVTKDTTDGDVWQSRYRAPRCATSASGSVTEAGVGRRAWVHAEVTSRCPRLEAVSVRTSIRRITRGMSP